MTDDIPSPDEVLREFNGRARLFPLPNLTMFPHVLQPLHIFEPRYRAMVREALDSDRLIAMVLLEQGWEDAYEGNPPVHAMACLGHVLTDQMLDDGCYNILLRGLKRVRIVEENPHAGAFRVARVKLAEDVAPDASDAEAQQVCDRLRAGFLRWLGQGSRVAERFAELLDPSMPLGVLTDVLAFTIRLEVAQKQELLEELDVSRRAAQLLGYLRDLSPLPQTEARRHPYPPDFSEN